MTVRFAPIPWVSSECSLAQAATRSPGSAECFDLLFSREDRLALLLSIFASDILPIFAIAGVGFVLARRFAADVRTLSHIVFYALVPCLVFHLLVTSRITSGQFGQMALLNVLIVASMGLIARAIAVPLRLSRPELSAFMLVVMISNAGNYGMPVVLFAFGPDALADASAFFVTGSVLTYTVGVFVAASGRRS